MLMLIQRSFSISIAPLAGERTSWRQRTVVGDVGHLEALAAIALVGLELDPELTRARGEGDGPLVGLTRLIGGDGGGQSCGEGGGALRLTPSIPALLSHELTYNYE